MKKLVLCICALSILCFSACASTEPTTNSSSSESQKTDQSSAADTSACQTDESSATESSIDKATETDYSRFETEPYSYSLYNEQGISVEFIEALDYYDQSDMYAIRLKNSSETTAAVALKNFLINNNSQDSYIYKELLPGDSDITILTSDYDIPLSSAILSEGKERVETISADLVIEFEQFTTSYNKISESVTANIPETEQIGYLCEPIKGASASTQTLYEDEESMITLLGLGKYYSQSDYTSDYMVAFICVENISDNIIPLYFGSCNINNIESPSDIYNTPSSLEPGQRYYCYIKSEVPEDIDSVNSVSYQILTSNEENTGDYNEQKGGKILSVQLNETGEQSDMAASEDDYLGPLIWEGYDVQIYSKGTRSDSEDSVDWLCRIVNNGTEAVSVDLTDEIVNGDANNTGYCYIYGSNIAPEASYDGYISAETNSGKLEDISFRVQIKTGGEGSILYNSPDTITLTYDGPSIEISDDIQYSYYDIEYGEPVTFKASATGNDLTYQWFSKTSYGADGTLLDGETEPELIIDTTDSEATDMYYYCRIRSSDGKEENTNDYSISVRTFAFPQSTTVHSGEKATFEVTFYSDELKENTEFYWFYTYPGEDPMDIDLDERIIEGENGPVLSFVPTEDQNGMIFYVFMKTKQGEMLGYAGAELTIEE